MKINIISIACLSSCILTSLAFAAPIDPDHHAYTGHTTNSPADELSPYQVDTESSNVVHNLAQSLVYRADGQCPDLILNSRASIASGSCTFKMTDQDANMQVPLFVSQDIDTVYGHCTFVPARPGIPDHIYQILGSKSALENGSSTPSLLPTTSKQTIQGNEIAVLIKNTNSVIETDRDDVKNKSHMNILFYSTTELNDPWGNGSYTIGDTLNCTFFSFN